MRHHWLVQGLIANWIASLAVVSGAAAIAYLSGEGSPLVTPILRGLSVMALSLLCIVLARSLFGVRPTTAGERVRIWLDHAGAATKALDAPELMFHYHVTLNGKIFTIGQFKKNPEFIHFHTDLSFTEADNNALMKLPGGLPGVIRSLRIYLALKEVGHSGVVPPLSKIVLTKRILIGRDFNADKFIDALFQIESALNLVWALITPEKDLVPKASTKG